MASFNQLILLGNVGGIEIKTFQDGGKVANVTLATNKQWSDRNGEKHTDTQWHRVVIGGNLADVVDKYVKKGDPLHIVGEMTYRKYTGKDGAEHSIPEVRVSALQLFPKKDGAGSPRPSQAEAQAQGETHSDDLPF